MYGFAGDCSVDVSASMLAFEGKHGTRGIVGGSGRALRARFVLALLPFAIAVVGCGARTGVIAERIDLRIETDRPAALDLTNFGLTLNRVINGALIRPRELVDSRPLLDSYFAQVAVVGPKSTPGRFDTDDAKLAYVLNCHNAVLMRSLIALSTGETVPDRVPRDFDRRFSFHVDGKWRTLADLRAWATSLSGDDWRVALALPPVSGHGPAIPNRPYLPELLDAQLDNTVRDGLASPRVARVDHGELKQILFWDGLWSMRERLVTDYQNRYQTTDARLLNVLLAWADSGFRRETLNSAVGYAENRMPADARIPWDGVILNTAG